ncbi:MAG: alpha/beta fold hydrolase, partial [Casimicrobiaceae bacterium]
MSTIERVPHDWPNRTASQSVRIGALDWHVQLAGSGPALCLLHGTGSSAHSWGAMLPMLARSATVIAPDLPGHGFTTGASRRSLNLPAIASELRRLIEALAIPGPLFLVGHSAGAALALRWALDAPEAPPAAILGFNPSLVAPPAFYTRVLGPVITPVATSGPVTGLL